jgi:Helix-turn-helix domain
MQDVILIENHAAAAVFASARQRDIVQRLIGEEQTLTALARAIQTPLSLVHYHVSKCISLGLIEVIREQRRAGRSVKCYRARAKTFFVPAELLLDMPGTGLTQKLRESLDQSLARSLQGINFTHDGCGPRMQLVRDPSPHAAAIELWLEVGLDRVAAAELVAELKAVVDRFRLRDTEKGARYLLHLAAVKI